MKKLDTGRGNRPEAVTKANAGLGGMALTAIAAVLAACPVPSWAAGPGEPLGAPIMVAANTHRAMGLIGAAADGRSVVAWPDADTQHLLVQRYAADGSALGARIDVAPLAPIEGLSEVQLAVNRSGAFVVLYKRFVRTPLRTTAPVHARSYDGDGNPVSDDREVLAAGQQIQVAIDDDGDYTLAWQSRVELPAIGIPYVILCCGIDSRTNYVQRFDASGTAITPAKLVASTTSSSDSGNILSNPAVASDGAGNFTVAWADNHLLARPQRTVNTRAYSARGVALGPVRTVESFYAPPRIAMTGNGAYTLAYVCSNANGIPVVCLHGYLPGGASATATVPALADPTLTRFDVAVDASGRSLLATSDSDSPNLGGNGSGLFQGFGNNGLALGPALPIGDEQHPVLDTVDVASDASGRGFVLYSALALDPSTNVYGSGLFLQRFASH